MKNQISDTRFYLALNVFPYYHSSLLFLALLLFSIPVFLPVSVFLFLGRVGMELTQSGSGGAAGNSRLW